MSRTTRIYRDFRVQDELGGWDTEVFTVSMREDESLLVLNKDEDDCLTDAEEAEARHKLVLGEP